MPDKRPNFLIIVADDLGYSDVGCYGSEIQTPNIDRIAKEGCLFTDFHTAASCSPTRSMLLSGTDNHLAGVGVMSEQRANDPGRWNKRGHEGYLNHDVAALPEVLHDAGYHTLLSGKWHLGLKAANNPHARGFDRSFCLLPGCSNHWGYEPQFDNEDTNFQGTRNFIRRWACIYSEHGVKKDIPPNTTSKYCEGFFSSNYYAENLVRYFEERTDEEKEKPFFAYLPFTAPHWPLQCSEEDREKYKGLYDDGPSVLRLRRLENLKKLGIVDELVTPHPVVGEDTEGVANPDWDEMTLEQRAKSARSMECFAGMVDNMDQNIGKVLDYLDKSGEADNTLVLFMSDNGAEGAVYESYPVMGRQLMGVLKRYYNNSLENIGNHDSFVWYGPRWAQAATAPHRLYKMYSTEGGIRVPLVVKYPPSWPNNQIVHSFSTVMDIMPTLLDLARVPHPVAPGAKQGTFHGHTVYPMRGHSWDKYLTSRNGSQRGRHAGKVNGVSSLTNEDAHQARGTSNRAFARSDLEMTAIYGEEDAMGWEMFGRAALRKGKFKIVYMPIDDFGKSRWELFDVSIDPGEINDLASTHPEVMEKMMVAWEVYCQETGTVWGVEIGGSLAFAGMGEESVGGDPIAQTTAWMTIGEGQAPSYGFGGR